MLGIYRYVIFVDKASRRSFMESDEGGSNGSWKASVLASTPTQTTLHPIALSISLLTYIIYTPSLPENLGSQMESSLPAVPKDAFAPQLTMLSGGGCRSLPGDDPVHKFLLNNPNFV